MAAGDCAAESEGSHRWREEVATGIRTGAPDGIVTVVEFMDFECPFCERWAARMDSLMAEYPSEVTLVMHHFPLESHGNAMAAAVAVECADRQDASRELQRALFANQEQLGTRPWSDYAKEAGVPDSASFADCIRLPADSFPRIAYGMALGRRSGVRGTPTVWVNGEVRKPSLTEFRELIRRLEKE